MSKYFYRIFTIIDLHFGAMQPCSSGLGMTLEASDFRSVRRLVAYSRELYSRRTRRKIFQCCTEHCVKRIKMPRVTHGTILRDQSPESLMHMARFYVNNT